MSVRGRCTTSGGGGAFSTSEPWFSPSARLYCYHEGAWNFLAVRTEENSEIVRSTYLSPSLKLVYVSFSLHFSLSTLLSLLNATVNVGE